MLVRKLTFKIYRLEKDDISSIMQSLIDACSFLWPSGIMYDKVISIVTDQTDQLILAVAALKTVFPNLHHVTCLARLLHGVCETMCQNNQNDPIDGDVDQYLASGANTRHLLLFFQIFNFRCKLLKNLNLAA